MMFPASTKADEVTTIQLRKPDGTRTRLTVSSEQKLDELWSIVEKELGMQRHIFFLVQAYPRIVYNNEHMNSTLKELGLFPNGNLVFEKSEVNQENKAFAIKVDDSSSNQFEMNFDHQEEENAEENFVMPDDDQLHPDPDHEEIGDDWLNAGGQNMNGEEEENIFENEFNDDDDDDLNQWMHQVAFQPQGHDWGQGHNLMTLNFGVPDLSHRERDPRQMAAEAANKRFDTCQHKEDILNHPPSRLLLTTVESLKKLAKLQIVEMLNGPKPPYSLSGLPSSLASEILQRLVEEKLLKPRMMWSFVACHLESISFDNYAYCTNELLHTLRHHHSLKFLSLKNCSLVTDVGIESLRGLTNLSCLDLTGCSQVTDGIAPVLISLRNLKVLKLERTSITDRGLVQYFNSNPPYLVSLDLRGMFITERTLLHLKYVPNLKSLNFKTCQLSDIKGVEEVRTLERLNLSSTPVSTDAIGRLEGMTRLRCLDLSHTTEISSNRSLSYLTKLKLTEFNLPNRLTLSDKGIPFLCGMPLMSLDLSNYIYITDESMPHIGTITTLRKLFLSNTKITDDGLTFLKGLKYLEELVLDRVMVTDSGAAVVKFLPKLRELSLSMTNITDKFILKGNLKELKNLTKLNLSKTHITTEGLSNLHLPNLTTLNVDETYCKLDLLHCITDCPNLSKIIFKKFLRVESQEVM